MEKYLDIEKATKHEGNCDTNRNWGPWNGPLEPGKETW